MFIDVSLSFTESNRWDPECEKGTMKTYKNHDHSADLAKHQVQYRIHAMFKVLNAMKAIQAANAANAV